MHVPESVSRQGIIVGKSTLPAITRPIAISYKRAVTHTYIGGANGTGKTTVMVNMARQMMENGNGIVLLEQDGNLFQQVLDEVPPNRIGDVICIDLSRSDRPVGVNLVRLNKPEIVARAARHAARWNIS